MRMAGAGAPLHVGHWGGCASSRLDHGVDLQASRTKFTSPNGFQSWISASLAALAAKSLISTSSKNEPSEIQEHLWLLCRFGFFDYSNIIAIIAIIALDWGI